MENIAGQVERMARGQQVEQDGLGIPAHEVIPIALRDCVICWGRNESELRILEVHQRTFHVRSRGNQDNGFNALLH